jgi:hypothetical protein
VAPELDERRRRQWAAAEAREVGCGSVSVVARATGLARSTIHAGLCDVRASQRRRVRAAERIRRAGGGRRPLTTSDPALLTALWALTVHLTSCVVPEQMKPAARVINEGTGRFTTISGVADHETHRSWPRDHRSPTVRCAKPTGIGHSETQT